MTKNNQLYSPLREILNLKNNKSALTAQVLRTAARGIDLGMLVDINYEEGYGSIISIEIINDKGIYVLKYFIDLPANHELNKVLFRVIELFLKGHKTRGL